VTNIQSRAFSGCSSLTSVTIPSSVSSVDYDAFGDCAALRTLFFAGNAPSFDNGPVNSGSAPTIYYLPGTAGWGNSFSGRPAVLWNPEIQVGNSSTALSTHALDFTIVGTPNIPFVLETAANVTTALGPRSKPGR
jgi:hypothetical protein